MMMMMMKMMMMRRSRRRRRKRTEMNRVRAEIVRTLAKIVMIT